MNIYYIYSIQTALKKQSLIIAFIDITDTVSETVHLFANGYDFKNRKIGFLTVLRKPYILYIVYRLH